MNRSSSATAENAQFLGPADNGKPSTGETLAHLDQILKSDLFTGAPKQRHLLRHLVEKHVQGQTAELKEYTIGLDVFGRGVQFDPRLDPIVRVEISRLRTRLQKYYERTSLDDRVRIDLPRGGYVPCFKYLEPEKPVIDASAAVDQQVTPQILKVGAPTARDSQRWIRLMPWITASVICIAGLVLWVWGRQSEMRPPEFVRFDRVTGEQARCTAPSFSPGGKFLVYARKDNQRWSLYRRHLGTLEVINLLPNAASDNYQSTYSPVDDRIAFRSDRDGGGIFLLEPKSGRISRLTNFGFYPAWSPDGSQIVFSTETFTDPAEAEAIRPSSLYIVDVKSKLIRPVEPSEPTRDALQPAWSPHGKMIAYWGTAHGGKRNIWVISAKASKNEAATPVRITDDTWTDWNPIWSRSGRYLYFSSDRGGSMNIWRLRIDEGSGKVLSAPEPVTTPSSYSGWAVLAPDGKRIAYVRRLVSSKLYSVPLDPNRDVQVNQKVQLTAGEQRVREPDMSPDGQWLVVRIQDPQEDLALLRPNGSDLHRLTNDRFSDRSPHWSPDGRQIVFISNRSGRFELWSIRPEGNGLRQLTTTGNVPSAWAPDGTLMGYPDGGKPIVLDPPGHPASHWGLPAGFVPLAWSPGGRAVVGRIRSDALGRSPLYIYTPASQDFWEIASSAAYPSVVWLRDGSHLLFSQHDGITAADLRTHQLHQLMPIPQGNMHWRFAVSRDEHTLFFALSDDQDDIWIAHDKS